MKGPGQISWDLQDGRTSAKTSAIRQEICLIFGEAASVMAYGLQKVKPVQSSYEVEESGRREAHVHKAGEVTGEAEQWDDDNVRPAGAGVETGEGAEHNSRMNV